jgi:hypothetical protein
MSIRAPGRVGRGDRGIRYRALSNNDIRGQREALSRKMLWEGRTAQLLPTHRREKRFASFNYSRPSSVGGSKSTVQDAHELIFLELRYKIEC